MKCHRRYLINVLNYLASRLRSLKEFGLSDLISVKVCTPKCIRQLKSVVCSVTKHVKHVPLEPLPTTKSVVIINRTTTCINSDLVLQVVSILLLHNCVFVQFVFSWFGNLSSHLSFFIWSMCHSLSQELPFKVMTTTEQSYPISFLLSQQTTPGKLHLRHSFQIVFFSCILPFHHTGGFLILTLSIPLHRWFSSL